MHFCPVTYTRQVKRGLREDIISAFAVLLKLLSNLQNFHSSPVHPFSSSIPPSTSTFSNMSKEDGMKCCQCSWVYPRAIYVACTNADCLHKFCDDCQPVSLNDGSQKTDTEDQRITYVNVDTNMSSTRVLSASNGGELGDCSDHTHSPANHPSIYFAVGTASEGLPLSASSSTFDEPSQAGPALPEQIIAPPEHSASGPDDKPVDGECFWTCDLCGGGPWLYQTVASCLNCGHIPCSYCTYGGQ